MGVHGLTQLIQAFLAETPFSPVPRGTRVLVDGPGWAFHLLNRGPGPPLARHHGGDYAAMEARVTEDIAALRAAGLCPEVFWDGPRTKLKSRTHASRLRQRRAERRRLFQVCFDGAVYPPDDLPPPPLFTAAVRSQLTKLSVPQRRCDYEADGALARESATTGALVYACDSDFLFFAGCRYVPFGCGLRPAAAQGGFAMTMEARVLSRQALAARFAVSEALLVEWACYLGNDYTGPLRHCCAFRTILCASADPSVPLDVDVLDDAPARRGRQHHEQPEDVLETLARCLAGRDDADHLSPPALLLDSASPELATAIRFSRAYYEHKPLDTFADDDIGALENKKVEDQDDEEEEDDEDEDEGDEVQRLERAFDFRRTVGVHAASAPGFLVAASVLQHDVLARSSDDAQRRALQKITQAGTAAIDEAVLPQRLRWEDVKVACLYQKACGRLLRHLARITDGTAPALTNPRNAPSALFHGPTFHWLVQRYRPLNYKGDASGYDGAEKEDEDERGEAKEVEQTDEERAAPQVLPIDEHKVRILDHINTHRVTIIQGETGCGKSSRVPVILFEGARTHGNGVRMFVSQPRRIAATTLKRRVAESVGPVVGLRLGNGVRDETSHTRIWYCTAGYLCRLAAHHPEAFKHHTHLIIDEIHERSVDTDLLCYMARRLLDLHPQLRLVVMSATIRTDTYADYFGIPRDEYLFVGARRFPLTVNWLDGLDAVRKPARLPAPIRKNARTLLQAIEKSCGMGADASAAVTSRITDLQVALAFDLARVVGRPGRSVLIFVAGMRDIEDFADRFAELEKHRSAAATRYVMVPIHSEIPFDDQMLAFEKDPRGDAGNCVDGSGSQAPPVKIVVATNSAESSITIPDCDHVICLGTSKRIEYNAKQHRIQLVHRWISKAGVEQRAGRTARTRPGTVWRLYGESFHATMDEFDPPELQQTPLEHVIIQLRSSLQSAVVPVLENVISPPDLSHLAPAFRELRRMRYITTPDDDGELTEDGEIAAAMGIDLKLAQVVLFGVRLGVPREAVAVAAALSLDRLPFRVASPLVHDPAEMAKILRAVCTGLDEFDAGMYSSPLMLTRILRWHRAWKKKTAKHTTERARREALARFGLVNARVRRLDTLAQSIEHKLSKFVDGMDEDVPLVDVARCVRTQTLLRLCLVWSFSDQIFQCASPPTTGGGSQTNNKKKKKKKKQGYQQQPLPRPSVVTLQLRGDNLTQDSLRQVLGPELGRDFSLLGSDQVNYVPHFPPGKGPTANDFCAFISDTAFDGVDFRWLETPETGSSVFVRALSQGDDHDNSVLADVALKGVHARLALMSEEGTETVPFNGVSFVRYQLPSKKMTKREKRLLKDIQDTLEATLHVRDEGLDRHKLIAVKGVRNSVDASSIANYFTLCQDVSESRVRGRQTVSFPVSKSSAEAADEHAPPIIDDIPLGARMLLMLASHDRRGRLHIPLSQSVPAAPVQAGGASKNEGVAAAATTACASVQVSTKFSTQREFLSAAGSGCKTIMERSSLANVAYNLDCDPAKRISFGTAATVLAVGHNASMMVMQHVTFCPPGRKWVDLALLCMRVRTVGNCPVLSDEEEDSDYDGNAPTISARERRLTEAVATALCGEELLALDEEANIDQLALMDWNVLQHYDDYADYAEDPITVGSCVVQAGLLRTLEELFALPPAAPRSDPVPIAGSCAPAEHRGESKGQSTKTKNNAEKKTAKRTAEKAAKNATKKTAKTKQYKPNKASADEAKADRSPTMSVIERARARVQLRQTQAQQQSRGSGSAGESKQSAGESMLVMAPSQVLMPKSRKKKTKNSKADSNTLKCIMCGSSFTSVQQQQEHLAGAKHKRKLKKVQKAEKVVKVATHGESEHVGAKDD